ncbi:MAG: ribonuclease P protein component [Candidatus Thiosymbion ectosymbiont of Robbea hypermnestra]|nr:ribonuclease P protein component [Candidatus Thiosymbion ectosymbiont of Robbea hypermnestra]
MRVYPPDRHRPSPSPVGARLPRRARLKRPGDFRSLFARPALSVDACFAVRARHNDNRPARLGLAVSKKSARRAVERSRLKRVVRESFRHHRHHLHGVDLVVVCRRRAVTLSNGRLFPSLTAHWKRIQERLCATY